MKSIISKDGTTISYDEEGVGYPLILVDGALNTRMSGSKTELVDLLARHFAVYTYDRRGRGDSSDTEPYAVEREIDDIEALINEGGGSAFLYGHSSGGCLALEAAETLGPKVTKIAVYEVPYNDDPAAQRAWAAYIQQLGEALATDRRGDAVALFMHYVGVPKEHIAGMRQAPFWSGLEAIAPTLAYDHTEIMGTTGAVPRQELAAVPAPVLAMCGSSSPAFMCETARTVSQVVPHGLLRVLDGQDHDVQAAVLAPALVEFFGAQ
jgi:pimeloyl-ACP methyl ester carboxylesterase